MQMNWKKGPFIKRLPKKTERPGHLLWTELHKEMFSSVELHRHSVAIAAMVPRVHDNLQTGSRTWHHPHDVGFAGTKDAAVMRSWNLHHGSTDVMRPGNVWQG